MATFVDIKIDGVTLPTPALEGVDIAWNPVHSENTGRTASGTMSGTVKAWKDSFKIKFPPLTAGQVETIKNVCRKTKFEHNVTYTDLDGDSHTKTMYVGGVSGTQYSWVGGCQYITNMVLELVEC